MAKNETKVSLKDKAMKEMESIVEQHNELVKVINDSQSRLAEVKQMLVEKQGYIKGLEDCSNECEKDV
jgi:hypothetical protein